MPTKEELLTKEAEYRAHAAVLQLLAAESKDKVERARLLRNADAWTQLADQMKHLARGE